MRNKNKIFTIKREHQQKKKLKSKKFGNAGSAILENNFWEQKNHQKKNNK